MKTKDLLGKRFGKLLVIEECKPYFDGKRTRTVWKCLCDCGVSRDFKTENLQNGDTKSCGCLRVELLEINLIGQKFGKLTVVKKSNKRGSSSSTFWECLCDCGNIHVVSSQHLREDVVKSCGCLFIRTEEEELELSRESFFKNIEKTDSCWEWKGCKALGYGVLQYKKTTIKAHRFSYMIFKGKLDEKKYVCHKCDNKGCVNPEHLYLGTAEDNAKDALDRGLLRRGENSPMSKLSEDDVLQILKSKASTSDLMSEYGVSRNTILRIRKGESWKHMKTR